MTLLLRNVLPTFVPELERLLIETQESALSAQVRELNIVDRCRCGDDFCATFYTEPRPSGSYAPDHYCIDLDASEGMIILTVLAGKIAKIEVLYRDEIRKVIHQAMP